MILADALARLGPSPSRRATAMTGNIHTIVVLEEATTFSEIVDGDTGWADTFAGAPLPRGTVITSAVGITSFTADKAVAAYVHLQ